MEQGITVRRYGAWAGNPRGVAEDTTKCVEELYGDIMHGVHPRQCSRNRGWGPDGLYCKQHGAKMDARENRGEA